jgi:heptosyltransferase-1
MKILILRVSAIGDVVHTLPVIFLIKKICPQARISWLVQKKALPIIANQPFLENIWVLPNNFLYPQKWWSAIKITKQIRKTKWDAILDFQGIVKTSIISLILTGKRYGFDAKNSRVSFTSLFHTHKTNPVYKNIIQKNLALASDMLYEKKLCQTSPCIEQLKSTFNLYFTDQEKKTVETWLQINNITNPILFAPNTTWPSKQWPTESWLHILKKMNENNKNKKHSILLLGKDFGKQAKYLSEQIQEKNLSIHIVPRWDLLTTAYLITKSYLTIAPDTGILHIADFLNKKTIGIFCPTSAKKHGPFLKKENIENAIQVPCPHHYQKTHDKIGKMTLPPIIRKFLSSAKYLLENKKYQKTSTNTNCMYKLSTEDLYEKIIQIIERE